MVMWPLTMKARPTKHLDLSDRSDALKRGPHERKLGTFGTHPGALYELTTPGDRHDPRCLARQINRLGT